MGLREALSRRQNIARGASLSSNSIGLMRQSTAWEIQVQLLEMESQGEFGVDQYNSTHIEVEGSPNHDLTKPPGEYEYEADVADSFTRQPVQDEDNLYVGSDTIISVSKSDGSVNWEFDTGEGVELESAPVLLDNFLVVGVGSGKLFSIDYNGNERWRFEVPDEHSDGDFNRPPAYSDLAIIAPNTNGIFYFLDGRGDLIGTVETDASTDLNTPSIFGDGFNQGAVLTSSNNEQTEVRVINMEEFVLSTLEETEGYEYKGGPPIVMDDYPSITSSVSNPTTVQETNMMYNESGSVTSTTSNPTEGPQSGLLITDPGSVTSTTSVPDPAPQRVSNDWSVFTPSPPHSYNISYGFLDLYTESNSHSNDLALVHDQEGARGDNQDPYFHTANTYDMRGYDTLHFSTWFDGSGQYDQLMIKVGGDIVFECDYYNVGEHGWTARTADISSYTGPTEIAIGHHASGGMNRIILSKVTEVYME